jgi:hypothetical protein
MLRIVVAAGIALLSAPAALAQQATNAGNATNTSSAAAQAASASAENPLAGLDPSTIASKIINEPSAPNVNGARATLVSDPNAPGGKSLRVTVPQKGAHPWDSSVESNIKKPIARGDRLVLLFSARLEKGDNGITTATLPYNAVQLTSAPFTTVISNSGDIGPQWKDFVVSGTSNGDYAAGTVKVTIQIGNAKQTVDFGPIVLLDLGR